MKQRLLVAAIGVPLLILVLVFLPPLAQASCRGHRGRGGLRTVTAYGLQAAK